MSQIRRVLLVGHCGSDSPRIAKVVREACPGVAIENVEDPAQVEQAGSDSLLLVNRLLSRAYGDGGGVELIARLTRKPDPPAAMLVSNYPDAQAAAVAAGARPGFGKSALRQPQTRDRLRAAVLGEPSTQDVR